jgi:hypothetical protein
MRDSTNYILILLSIFALIIVIGSMFILLFYDKHSTKTQKDTTFADSLIIPDKYYEWADSFKLAGYGYNIKSVVINGDTILWKKGDVRILLNSGKDSIDTYIFTGKRYE